MAEHLDRPEDTIAASRASLIGKIYELVLSPEAYDAFMEDWDRHITEQVNRLEKLRDASELINDPVLEAHFSRAFAILERLGRGEPREKGANAAVNTQAATIYRDGRVHRESDAPGMLDGIVHFPDLEPYFDVDSWSRLAEIYANLRRAPAAGQFLVLAVSETTSEETGSAFLMAITLRDERSGEVVLRLEPLALNWNIQLSELLEQSFRLTPSEIRLVRALAEGCSLNALSRASGRTLNTLRSQLKSVFQKTRTNSQADLARLVSTLSGMSGDLPPIEISAGVKLQTGVMEVIALSGDRSMPVHMLGPENGIPVIFIHGMLDGVAVTTRINHLLEEFGIRFIAPVRPNFGQANEDRRVKLAPQLFGRDIAEFVKQLNLEKCLLAGHMAGALYAFAAACTGTQSIVGIISISGGVPIKSVRQFSLMTQRQRTVAYTARFAPKLLPAVLRAGIAQIDSANPEAFMNALYAPESPDRDVVTDPHIAHAILDGYRFAVAQGHRAFETDSYHVTRDWSELVSQSDCPVLIMHGVHDPVVNVATVRDFARSLGNRAKLHELDDSGQLLFYQKPEQVLASIVELWERINAGGRP